MKIRKEESTVLKLIIGLISGELRNAIPKKVLADKLKEHENCYEYHRIDNPDGTFNKCTCLWVIQKELLASEGRNDKT